MEYNKFLHNGKKRWLVVSVSLLAVLSGGLLMAHNGSNVHASATNPNQNQTSQQTQTNYTYQPQFHVDHSVVNNQNSQNNDQQQSIKPQINNLCGRILRNDVKSSIQSNNRVQTRNLKSVNNKNNNYVNNYKPEVTTDFEYKNINTGNIKLDDLIDGMAGDKINYDLYTQSNHNNLPKGFHFVKFGRHNNVFADDKIPAGNNVIWIAPNSSTNSAASSSSSQMSSSTINSKASVLPIISNEVVPPKQNTNSSFSSASTSISSSASSVVSKASAPQSTSVSSSTSKSQRASNTSASSQASHVTSQNSINNKSVSSNSVSMSTGQTSSNSTNTNESITSVSSSTSSSNVTPASETSEASSSSVSSTTSIESSSASVIPSFIPSSVSSNVSSSSVNVNSNLNSWYASLMNSIADNHQLSNASSASVSSIDNISSSSANPIVDFGSLNNNDHQSQMNSTTSVRYTEPAVRHVHVSRKLKNRMKTWRYHGHTYHTYRQYITSDDFRKGHHMYIRLIKNCNEYRSTHYVHRNCIRHLKKGMRLAIRRIVVITPHITRFQLMNGNYVTSNKYFAQVIK